MKISFVLRLLNLACFFLPFTFFFTTCNGFDVKFAYNKKEAAENKLQETKSTKVEPIDSTTVATYHDSLSQQRKDTIYNSDSTEHQKSFISKVQKQLERLEEFVLMPTDTSLSAIGCIFLYKNLAGKILISIALFISILTLGGF
jgi:hypothetical protein